MTDTEYEDMIDALTARLEAAERERDEMAAALDSEHATVGYNIWRFWAQKSRDLASKNVTLAAERDDLMQQCEAEATVASSYRDERDAAEAKLTMAREALTRARDVYYAAEARWLARGALARIAADPPTQPEVTGEDAQKRGVWYALDDEHDRQDAIAKEGKTDE